MKNINAAQARKLSHPETSVESAIAITEKLTFDAANASQESVGLPRAVINTAGVNSTIDYNIEPIKSLIEELTKRKFGITKNEYECIVTW